MIIFVIPAYNEAENIANLLKKTQQLMLSKNLPYKIVIINDGSTDNTLEVIASFKDKIPVEVKSYYPNKGVGEAFRVGFKEAFQICGAADIIVTKEADNTSDLSVLDKLLSKVSAGYDVVLASCYAAEGAIVGTVLYRLILSKVANMLFKIFLPIKNIHTYSSFYRAYSARAIKQMHGIFKDRLIEEPGFECMVELLMKFNRSGKFKITEVPMILDGRKRVGKSKMQILRAIKGFLRVILKEGIIYRVKNAFKRDEKQ